MSTVAKKWLWLLIAVIAMVVVVMLPAPKGLTMEGKNILGIILFALILWASDALPLGVSAFAIILLIPVLGIMPTGDTFKAFISPVIFFVIATYGISVAIMKSPLAMRMTRFLLKWAGISTGKVLFAFMVGSAAFSAIISNVPVTALMMGLALSIIEPMGLKPGESRLGKCFMLAIPFAAMIGGFATPAGSSVNVLALFLLNEYTGIGISFVDWMLMGIPICIVILPFAWWVIIKMFKPEKIEPEVMESIVNHIEIPTKLTVKEWKILAIIFTISSLWIASSWVPALNLTLIAIGGLLLFFLPGMNLFTWEQFNEDVGWDGILLIGSVTALGSAVVVTGLGSWIVETALSGFLGMGIVATTGLVGMLVNLLHLILPVAPALVSMSIVPFVDVANLIGINPAIFTFTIAALSGCCLLVPLDAVPIMTYTKKYYTIWDMFKAGSIVSIVLVILVALWLPFISGLIL